MFKLPYKIIVFITKLPYAFHINDPFAFIGKGYFQLCTVINTICFVIFRNNFFMSLYGIKSIFCGT